MPLLDFPDQLPLDDQIVPANFDCEYGLPHPAPFDFEYELPYTLPTPAIGCVPAEPDIYPNLSRWAAPFPSPPTAPPPSHLMHPRRPDQGSAFRHQGLRPVPLRLDGAPGCIRFCTLHCF
ncbi:unnamed protein product [Gadus morhua 'NCC']